MGNPLGRDASDAHDAPVTVVLLDAPLLLWQRATEHHDELMREMALLALAETRPELPTRLLRLVDVLGIQYGAASDRPEAEREAAVAAGLDRIDLTYELPRSQAANAGVLRDLLDEAEEFCRTDLLTLQQPEAEARFARWYIDQFVRQSDDLPPQPWPGPWD